jgi:hypothetical protein
VKLSSSWIVGPDEDVERQIECRERRGHHHRGSCPGTYDRYDRYGRTLAYLDKADGWD